MTVAKSNVLRVASCALSAVPVAAPTLAIVARLVLANCLAVPNAALAVALIDAIEALLLTTIVCVLLV